MKIIIIIITVKIIVIINSSITTIIIVRWDDKSGEHWIELKEGGEKRTVFFPTQQSIQVWIMIMDHGGFDQVDDDDAFIVLPS